MRRLLLHLASSAFILLEATAQDFSVNSSWTNTKASDSRGDREALASAAAQGLVQRIGSDGTLSDVANGQALASMYSALALQDILSGNKTWMANVTTNLKAWAAEHDIFTNGTAGSLRTTTNAAQWGLAFCYAYEAYGDASLLSLGQSAFNLIYPYFITAEDARTYHSPGSRTWVYNSTNGSCFSLAAGGIWWLPDVLDIDEVHADSVGSFAVFAAHLYQAMPTNDTYKTAGMLSTFFLSWNGIWSDSPPYVYNQIAIFSCEHVADPSSGPQGWYIHALAMWANITSDPTLVTHLRQLVSTATRNEWWTQPDGVLIDAPMGVSNDSDNRWDDKAILIRGLSETARRFSIWDDVTTFIAAFLNVQYNELTSSARSGSAYSTALFGPPPSNFDLQGNIMALDVLNAAFDALPKSNASATAPAPSSTSGSNSPSQGNPTLGTSVSTAAIAGGVIGGIACVVLAICTFWFCHRRHRRHSSQMGYASDENGTSIPETAVVEPYAVTTPGAIRVKGEVPAPPALEYREPQSQDAETPSRSTPMQASRNADDEEVLTMSAFRRLMSSFAQEHAQESAPPEYSSRAA